VTSPGSGSELTDADDLSVCCLLYLFANQVVSHSTILSHLDAQHGIRLPCQKTAVQLGSLERLVFAWAFWHLRECGLIELGYLESVGGEEADDAGSDDKSPGDIVVRRVGDVTGARGFEVEVLNACGEQDELIGPVLRRWAGQHIPLPLYAVVRGLHMEAASRGLVHLKEPDDRGDPFTDHRLAHFASEDCERIAALEPTFAELLSRWRVFETQRPQAAADLEEQCRLGLYHLRPPPTMALGGAPIH